MDANWLTDLKDIHYPRPISWFPFAPGWWLLLTALLILGWYGLRYWQKNQAARQVKKTALAELRELESRVAIAQSEVLVAGGIDAVLKRTALSFFPRESLAGLTGEAWFAFLIQHDKHKQIASYRYELIELPYQKSIAKCNMINLSGLLSAARAWIKQRSEPCSP